MAAQKSNQIKSKQIQFNSSIYVIFCIFESDTFSNCKTAFTLLYSQQYYVLQEKGLLDAGNVIFKATFLSRRIVALVAILWFTGLLQ